MKPFSKEDLLPVGRLPVGAQASFPVPSKEEPVILFKPESFKSKGCEECSGYIKFTGQFLSEHVFSKTNNIHHILP